MSKLEPDDTTEPACPPTDEPARRPGGDYYYDDATGYEIYQPEEGDDEDKEDGYKPRTWEARP